MKHTTHKLRALLEQDDRLGLEGYMHILYEACEKRTYCNDAEIRQTREALESRVVALEFRQQDQILCAVNALCAEYDYAGFSEGFSRGVELVLELLEQPPGA